MNGRPLRFAAGILGGWTALRFAMVWMETGAMPQRIVPTLSLASIAPSDAAAPPASDIGPSRPVGTVRSDRSRLSGPPRRADPRRPVPPPLASIAYRGAGTQAPPPMAFPLLSLTPLRDSAALPAGNAAAPRTDRWRASGWVFYRPGSGDAFRLGQPSLGASQAGVRVSYRFDPAAGLAATASVAAPLSAPGGEVSAGIAWQPFRLPVTLLAEQRFGFAGRKGGPSLALTGGEGPARIAGALTVESYGEAGAVARGRIDYFADGAVRIARPVGAVARHPIAIGLGAWGGIQRGLRRLDIGPSVTTDFRIADQRVRLSLDWRERIAGNAAPGSGIALTLGADF